jgi:thymidylate synthase (FAD)
MAHCIVETAERILDKEFGVLDKGFVRLIDYLGSDQRIVQAARVSYGEGTKNYREDRGLIHYLLRNDHTSPFEQVNFTFHLKMPIFIARQWIRHRTARINEISGRYSVMKDEFYMPDGDVIAQQSADNKQGRDDEPVPPEMQRRVLELLEKDHVEVYSRYQEMLDSGIARELARINLPLSLYTELFWQIDLHNLFHFLRLRLDPHAQFEIRAYAEVMMEIVFAVCPIASEAFQEYISGGVRFSKSELKAINDLLEGKDAGLKGKANDRFRNKLQYGHE